MKTNGNVLSIAGKVLDVMYNSGDTFVWRISTLSGEAGLNVTFQSIEEIENFVVTSPQEYVTAAKSDQEIITLWKQPLQGNVPILYDLAYSKFVSVDADGNPNGTDVIFVNNLEVLGYLLTNLKHSTKYYIFLRCKNIISESIWLKSDVTTDVPLTAESLQLVVESPDFESVTGSWVTPENREYLYDFSLSGKWNYR